MKATRALLVLAGLAGFVALEAPAAVVITSGGKAIVTSPQAAVRPWEQWEFTAETGLLWRIRNNTPLDYVIAPTSFVFHGPPHFTITEGENGALVVRPRLALLTETIIDGPESYYLGFAASPSLEWWLPGDRTSLFFSAGGGCGVVDSTDVVGGQGQDFTLNWFMELGVRHLLDNGWSILGDIFFQHNSNGGMTDPNPGIDSLGFTLGAGFRF